MKFNYLISIILIVFIWVSCSQVPPQSSKTLYIKGSDTMLPLLENLAVAYMTIHPDFSIYVEGGGTASGVAALIDGEADICSASRLLLPREASMISKRYRSVGVYSIIAKDALSIYVHQDNPVKDLTLKQLKQIFSGEIQNWQEVGGENLPIKVFIRPPNSGTNLYFMDHILDNREYASNAETIPTTSKIIETIQANIKAIGYGGIAYGPSEIHILVDGIRASEDNVRYDLYPISRYLYLYTIKKPKGKTRFFIDWILQKEGQQIVKESGFISLLPVE
jgi:phosphate transport system substrate-binding protein